jgi:serine phosphatase RsbU (regulator of sigma subunit)
MATWLIALDGDGARHKLAASLLVGRGQYNHVVLDDARISRQHAKISAEQGGFVLYDLNSANGSYVNDEQVKRHKLAPNDLLRFGPFKFRFEADGIDSALRTKTSPPARFVEVATTIGTEPAPAILDTLDVQRPGLLQLEDADRKLRTLYKFLMALAGTIDEGELIERILANLLEVFSAAEVAAIYVQEPNGELRTQVVKRRRETSSSTGITLPPALRDEVVNRARAVLSMAAPPPGKRPRGGNSMHAPIVSDRVLGVLHVRAAAEDMPFVQADLDLLSAMAAQAAIGLQNTRYHQESLKAERLRQDLALAEQIQKSFLPRHLPLVDGIEFATEYRPAFSVGGDFYDVFWLDYQRLGVFIGDVSGKGVSAALLMARITSDLRLAATVEPDPGRALEHVNRIVLERRQTEVFITGVYLTLDVRTRRVRLANAGHMAPIVRRKRTGDLRRLEGMEGTAIGIYDDAEYPSRELALEEGDTLVLCTDGVLEAMNPAGEHFGVTRWEHALAVGSSNAHSLAQRVLDGVRTHASDAAQNDDITLIAIGACSTPLDRANRRDEPTQPTD